MDPKLHKSESPWWAATKTFVKDVAIFTGIDLAFGVLMNIGHRGPGLFRNILRDTFFSRTNLIITGAFATIDAAISLGRGFGTREANQQLISDNIAMRAQLNQTGQILQHVADEVAKGHIPDSQLSLDESAAPPSQVAKLEAQKAAHAAQEALGAKL